MGSPRGAHRPKVAQSWCCTESRPRAPCQQVTWGQQNRDGSSGLSHAQYKHFQGPAGVAQWESVDL